MALSPYSNGKSYPRAVFRARVHQVKLQKSTPRHWNGKMSRQTAKKDTDESGHTQFRLLRPLSGTGLKVAFCCCAWHTDIMHSWVWDSYTLFALLSRKMFYSREVDLKPRECKVQKLLHGLRHWKQVLSRNTFKDRLSTKGRQSGISL